MPLEDNPVRPVAGIGHNSGDRAPPENVDYWHSLIDEKAAAEFLGLTDRTMQAMRQRGGGPEYVVISSRCLRYRRIGLRAWANARLRSSTSDPGPATAAA